MILNHVFPKSSVAIAEAQAPFARPSPSFVVDLIHHPNPLEAEVKNPVWFTIVLLFT